MSQDKKETAGGGMLKVAAFVVDKRNLFFLIYVILIGFSFISQNWVKVENELSAYLPSDSETSRGLEIMTGQFTTFGSAQVMVANVTWDEAQTLLGRIQRVAGVSSVAFDDTEDHYNPEKLSALYDVTFTWSEEDDKCLTALDMVEKQLDGYDCYVSTELGDQISDIIASEMRVIMVIVAFVVVSVLLLTSQTYAEVPVLLLTFLSAAIINKGTNYMLGTISFVSNSVTVVLQLALSVDYAIILCNRYKEERELLPARDAAVVALSKSITEIAASSLTTIGGLAAMMFMEFRIGADMGICLIKAVLLAMLSVFLLMPGLLMLFSGAIDRTRHRSFVPKIPFVGRFAYATRFVVPPLLAALLAAGYVLSLRCPYVYGNSSIVTPKQNVTQIARRMIEENFGNPSMVALVVPAGDYEAEKRLLAELETYPEVKSATGLSNVEAMDGYMLTDKLTPRQFSELLGVDYDAALVIYTAYAVELGDYAKVVNGLASYGVPLIDMFLFLHQEVEEGYVTLDRDTEAELDAAYVQMYNAKVQLQGSDYSRMLVYLDLPGDGDETFAFLDTMHGVAARYYDGDVYLVGSPVSAYDLEKTYEHDNLVVSMVSILIVLAVLLFTFKSAGMPVLLILVIQGSIWINFAIPALAGSPVFFMSYLIVSSIQMGANIDYAIVISSRYMELRGAGVPRREAIIQTMTLSFPTIITSGSMMVMAGVLIGNLTSQECIVGIGQSLGRGTGISLLLVMFALPQVLVLGDAVIRRTAFTMNMPLQSQSGSGLIRLDGIVHGQINGTVNGVVHALVRGSVDVSMVAGTARREQETAQDAQSAREDEDEA